MAGHCSGSSLSSLEVLSLLETKCPGKKKYIGGAHASGHCPYRSPCSLSYLRTQSTQQAASPAGPAATPPLVSLEWEVDYGHGTGCWRL